MDPMACACLQAYRWLKPKDAMYVADILPTVDCAITRQLLGDSWSNNGFCGPTDADAPLHVWLKEHGMDPASTGIDSMGGEGELTKATPGRENYVSTQAVCRCVFCVSVHFHSCLWLQGRLQGDVGHLAWSRSGALGGYKAPLVGREELEGMTKEQLIEWALLNQQPVE